MIEPMHTMFRFYDRKNNIEFTDVLEVHIVELPKLKYDDGKYKNNPEIAWPVLPFRWSGNLNPELI